MRILLINPPNELETMFGPGKEFIQKYEPLGLLYIGAVVRDAGYEVSVVDAFAENLSLDELKERVLKEYPGIIGITTLTCSGEIVFRLGQWIKENLPETTVVLGNVHASSFAEQYLKNNCCDIVVHGEGEFIFLKIVEHRNQRRNPGDIEGISFVNEQNQVVTTSSQVVVQDLARLPLPARDLVRQDLYNLTEISNQFYIGGKSRIAKTMATSRGCPNRCSFCVVHKNGRFRYNDPIKVVDEMEILEKDYDASYVFIMDPLFIGNRDRTLRICSEIKKRNLKIRWGCDSHVNCMEPEVIRAMDSAGCYEMSLGIESGVQRLLDNVNKEMKVSDVRNAVEIIKKNSDIFVTGLFILGLPGERYEDSIRTIEFSQSLPLDMAQFSILVPYPGSQLFLDLSRRGELDTGIREGGRVVPSVWKRYSGYICFTENEPIWVTKDLKTSQLRELQKKALRGFYLRPVQIAKQIRRVRVGNIWKLVRIGSRAFF